MSRRSKRCRRDRSARRQVREITVEDGEPYGTLPTPVRNGYDFLGWYTQEEGGLRVDETSAAGTAAVLYAHYEPLTVRLDLYAVGGGLDVTEIQVMFGKTYEKLPTPVKAGFLFDGWYTAYDGGEKVNKTDIVTATSAMPLYAPDGMTASRADGGLMRPRRYCRKKHIPCMHSGRRRKRRSL